jgi:hypothetical protein
MPEVFPPFATYPLTREVHFATRVNQMPDLTEYRATETATPLFRWDLTLEPLTDIEAATVQSFLQARGGGYESFSFLDPLDNLLQWSEDFTQAVWQKSAPADLVVTGQTLLNIGATALVVRQTIPVNPAGITFTGSAWMKAATAPITLRLTGGVQTTFTPASGWTRFSVSEQFTVAAAQTGVDIEIPAGASVDVAGAQLVAAPGPANYTRTTTVSGFHANCRFASDVFDHRVLAPNANHVRVVISEF